MAQQAPGPAVIYPDLLIQRRPWELLQAAVRTDRLGHAYLFHGPAGSGKEAHAIELAALLNCQTPENESGCGHCPACQKMLTLQHPDLQIVVPLPRHNALAKNDPPLKALRPADLEDLTAQLQTKGSDPYHKIALRGASSILINSVRELRRKANLKPSEGGWRVVLIFDAEKLSHPNQAAANALLKLLEEPPQRTVIILVTDRPNLLLPTIHSRCLQLYFPAPASGLGAEYLQQRYNLDPQAAGILIRASAGNLHLARQIIDSGEARSITDLVDPLLEALMEPKPKRWERVVGDLAQLHRRNPEELRYRLQTLQLWCRDLMVLEATGASEGLVFGSRLQELQHHLARFPDARWGAATKAVESALNLLERNVNPTLVITNMLMDIRQVMRGREIVEVGSLAPLPGPA